MRAALAMVLAAALVACASPDAPGPRADATEAILPLPRSEGSFEDQHRERALAHERQGRLAEAALAWEVLTVLRPGAAAYAERLEAVQRRIDAGVSDRLQRATQAQRRGEADQAVALYLSALSLQPSNAQASEALRAIERDRNRRLYLGKPSRLTLARQPLADGRQAQAPSSARDRNELEHASLLLAEGEVDEAIGLLERRVASRRTDEATRRLLADAYFHKSERMASTDRTQALALLEKTLRLDAEHPRAVARLKQLKPLATGR